MKQAVLYLILWISLQTLFSEEIVPRTVIVLYNEGQERDISFLNVHQLGEMPSNHLGICLRYHDIKKGFPHIAKDPEVLGILSWFLDDQSVTKPHEYIEWVEKSVKPGKKFVMMGSLGFLLRVSFLLQKSTAYGACLG